MEVGELTDVESSLSRSEHKKILVKTCALRVKHTHRGDREDEKPQLEEQGSNVFALAVVKSV